MDLSGRVFVVTGADGALGKSVAASLSGYGGKLALLSHAGTPAGKQPSGAWQYGGIDFSQEAAARSAMQRVGPGAGGIDGLINIAGGVCWGKIPGGTVDTWDAMYKINVRTAVISCQAALPYLLRSSRGRIVNVGAMGAIKASTGMGPYAASKAGVVQLTEALADELKDRGITVNAILPSTLDTPRKRQDMPQPDFKRLVTLNEAAELIAFLLSDQAIAVTGPL